MRRLIPLLLLLAAPAGAQEWRTAPEYDVLLTSYAISPRVIHLRAGEPVRLHFVNNSNVALTFDTPAFFRSAELRERDADAIRRGTLTLGPLSDRTNTKKPQTKHKATQNHNFIHRLLGMSSRIVVE